ncbi:sodium-coupled monocarboxylate transporter 1-like [Diorhabda carinulata]|uniref:sodium-coupled monocarboxylate transporter 1-like n=1 Tax=Diorhabda carinulata TaxID=1163345 RepID=UPI0025A285AA|nr:sodium-coupled monocarboxylate transporter 1-like [Diorhabda carinulata]
MENGAISKLGVLDVGRAMQRFGIVDYVIFLLMLSMCLIVGLSFGIFGKNQNSQDYLVGGRNMKILPIAMSLIATWVSGISLLGIPTEIYVYGIQYTYIIIGFLLTTLVFGTVYLPVFQQLQLTSTYEYHQMRFDKNVRLFGSVLFAIGMVAWLPLVIYVPALAFNQVTGVNVHLTTPAVCIICVIYTSMGGLKGVVWTDVIQIFIMFGAILLVVIKGTIDVGGIGNVFRRNWESDRIEGPNFDPDPMARHTIWALVIGGGAYTLQSAGVNQNMVQRYLALPSLRESKKALWVFFFGLTAIVLLCSYCGMLIYATYYKCDPLTTKLAREKDQLLPLLVMEILGDIPGLPGLFVAGIFSAALSSLSTGLNAMAAVVLEDFYKPFFKKELSEKQTYFLMKTTVLVIGTMCVGLVFVVEKLGAVLQLAMSIGAISNGPSLGLFTMGVLFPWINAKGALIGGVSSLIFMSWLCISAQSLISSGDLTFPEKSVSTDGCHYNFIPKYLSKSMINITEVTHTDEKYMILRLSYLWYCLIGSIFAIFIAAIVSYITTPLNPEDVDAKLLAPFVRKIIQYRKNRRLDKNRNRQRSGQHNNGDVHLHPMEETNMYALDDCKIRN